MDVCCVLEAAASVRSQRPISEPLRWLGDNREEILTDNSRVTSFKRLRGRQELFMSSQNLASAAGGCLRSPGQTMHLFELPPPVPWACTFESVDNWWDLFLFLLKVLSELFLLFGSASPGHLTLRSSLILNIEKMRDHRLSHTYFHTYARTPVLLVCFPSLFCF